MAFNLALIGLDQKGDTRRAFAAVASSNYFSVFGVSLARGRAFLPEEETRNAPVAIVSYSYWQKHNLDPTVLGSEVLINGRAFTIVGIAPKGFTGTLQILSPEVWLPLSVYDQVANDFGAKDKSTMEDRNGTQLRIVGRLKPGMSAAAAEPALEGLAANLEKAYPVEQKNQTFMCSTRNSSVKLRSRRTSWRLRVGALGVKKFGITSTVRVRANVSIVCCRRLSETAVTASEWLRACAIAPWYCGFGPSRVVSVP